MILLNDLFAFKLQPDSKTYQEYIGDEEVQEEEYYLDVIQKTNSVKYYDYGMYFVYKYTNELQDYCINKKANCINTIKRQFIKNPKWYTYDILKYLVLDMEFDILYKLFDDHPLYSIVLGEYILRNGLTKNDVSVSFTYPFFVSLPFYIYKKDFVFDDFDIDMVFLFPNLIYKDNIDLRLQHYYTFWQNEITIDQYKIKTDKLVEIDFVSENPYTNFLLHKNHVQANLCKSTELMILLYDNADFIIEGSIYTEIIKDYHNIHKNKYTHRKDELDKINYFVYEEITNKYCLVKNNIKNDFLNICKKYKFTCLLEQQDTWLCEYILNLEEHFFNIFMASKKSFVYKWNNNVIEPQIMNLIREIHTAKLMNKKWIEKKEKELLEHKYHSIALLYFIRRNKSPEYLQEDEMSCICDSENKEFLIKRNILHRNDKLSESCNCKDFIYLDYITNKSKYEEDERYKEIQKKYKFTKSVSQGEVVVQSMNTQEGEVVVQSMNTQEGEMTSQSMNTQENKIAVQNKMIPRRYKIVHQKNEKNNKQVINDDKIRKINIIGCMRSKRYKKILRKYIIYVEYINHKYKSTNHKFINYLTDENAKQVIGDLIRYDMKRLVKLTRRGYKMDEYNFLELQEKLRGEGDDKILNYIGIVLSHNKQYKLDILVYEDLDYYGKCIVIDYLHQHDISDFNRSDFIKLLCIINNETNFDLLTKILRFLKINSDFFDKHSCVIEKYKKMYKFQKLISRIFLLIDTDTKTFNDLCTKHCSHEEFTILSQFYKEDLWKSNTRD